MKKLLPVLLALLGLGIGGGAGYLLQPETAGHSPEPVPEITAPPEFAKLPNQFVIPIVEGGRIASMVVMSLSLEVEAGLSETVFSTEPKLRDAILRVLFDHANTGGFRGSFTDATNLVQLRKVLLETAQQVLGQGVKDILITEIMRQDG